MDTTFGGLPFNLVQIGEPILGAWSMLQREHVKSSRKWCHNFFGGTSDIIWDGKEDHYRGWRLTEEGRRGVRIGCTSQGRKGRHHGWGGHADRLARLVDSHCTASVLSSGFIWRKVTWFAFVKRFLGSFPFPHSLQLSNFLPMTNDITVVMGNPWQSRNAQEREAA